MKRIRESELMDRPEADPRELHRSLADLAVVNLFLGGRHTSVDLVLRLADQIERRPITLLDVGTGGADIPRQLASAARRKGEAIEITASDLHETTLAYAARASVEYPEITFQRADALQLPFPDNSFDIVTNATTLHHFDRAEAVKVLGEMARVARRAVIVTDLARSRAALLGAQLLALTLWRNHPITRHDGPVSVKAAFTPAEMMEMAREASDGAIRVRRHPLFRLSLVIDKAGVAGR